jgi:hypothetical protein
MSEKQSIEIVRLLNNHFVNCYAEDFPHISHTTILKPTGAYHIKRWTIDSFYDKYSKLIEKDIISAITEKPQYYSMLVVDFDIKVKLIGYSKFNLYERNFVDKIIQTYQQVLKEHGITDCYLDCIFLSKDPYIVKKPEHSVLKHGFHLQFPKVFLGLQDRIFIRERVEELLNIEIDAIENHPWLLYGSRKSLESGTYTIDTIYNHALDKIDLKEYMEKYEVYNHFEKRVETTPVRMLSILLFGRPYALELKRVYKNKNKKDKNKEMPASHNLIITHTLSQIKELVDKIKNDDLEWDDWWKIGSAIYTETEEQGFDIFNEFSRLSDKYDEEITQKTWNNYKYGFHTCGTLYFYASKK